MSYQLKSERDRLNQMRTKFFQIENKVQKEIVEHQNLKYKLINNTHEIMRQGDQIEEIKGSGFETATLMKQANTQLRHQRDIINKIGHG